METKKRKLIDLDDNTFKILSINAIKNGTNLKDYIETVLSKIASNIEDVELYSYLLKKFPEGQEVINEQEKKDFENWLGV